MSRSRPSLLDVVLACLVGMALLCGLVRPVFATVQELHEREHVLPDAGEEGLASTDSSANSAETWLEGALHAPHCCVHAVVLPQTLTVAALIVHQVPPRWVQASPRASPLSRFLRPPISA